MTTPSNLWGDEWGSLRRRMHVRGQVLSRRQARRVSRRFAGVGVRIPAPRVREIAAGAPVTDDELVDVNFAFAASAIKRGERLAKFGRGQRRGVRWLIFAGLVLVALNSLLCLAYMLFNLAFYTSPY